MSPQLQQLLNKIKPYLLNVKSILGLALLLFGLYSMATELPTKLTELSQANEQNTTLEQQRDSLAGQEQALKNYDAELTKLTFSFTEVGEGNTPELVGIAVAQEVQALAKKAGLVGGIIEPIAPTVIDVQKETALPGNLGALSLSEPAPQESTATAAASAPNAPATSSAVSADGKNTFNAFQYRIKVMGTYAALATFINQVSTLNKLVLLTQLDMKTSGISEKASAKNKASGAGGELIELKVEFAVPWKQKAV